MLLTQPVAAILRILDEVQALVQATPRDTDSASTSRFGNPAFRALYEKIVNATDALFQIIPGLGAGEDEAYRARARKELAVYFYESWGNAKRIDYGSGMELNFLCWMYVVLLTQTGTSKARDSCVAARRRSDCLAHFLEVYRDDADDPVYVLARAGRQPRRLGPG